MRGDSQMKRYIIFALLITLFVITGCGKKENIVNIELAGVFAGSELFEEKLEEINASTAEIRYGLNKNDYSELTSFVGTKSSCDEFIIVKTSNVEKVKSLIDKYLDEKIKIYDTYRPDDVYKLTKPFISEYNGTVVVVICHDTDAAEKAYKAYLKS